VDRTRCSLARARAHPARARSVRTAPPGRTRHASRSAETRWCCPPGTQGFISS
jgi:hypothetical protein